MKTLIQIITTIVALSLLAAGVVSAGNASGGEIQTTKAEIGTVLAKAQANSTAAPVPPTVPTPTPTPTPPIPQQTLQTLPGVSKNIYNFTDNFSFGSRTGNSDMVLMIPTEQTKTEDLIAINEDMNVMSRIFEKNLEQDRIATARSGIFISSRRDPYGMFLGGSRGDIQSMYLQDYGALFLLKVDFPLSPSSEAKEEEKVTEKTEEGDPVWRETRQQMFEPENVSRRHQREKQEEKYDPQQVENLKTTLIKTLKHATNIRVLKPDESVILTVVGSGGASGTKITAINVAGNNQVVVEQKDASGKRTMRIVNGTALDDIGLSSPTVLIIRAKKPEIDAFAKGELDFDKFQSSVQMFSYPYLGSVEVRGDSLDLYMDMPRSTGSSNIR
jgi:hypothetical protein